MLKYALGKSFAAAERSEVVNETVSGRAKRSWPAGGSVGAGLRMRLVTREEQKNGLPLA